MARKKTIMKNDILNAAVNLAMRDGFQNFTARKIADELNCSTQPLYLEFECMDDLKRQSIKKIQAYLLKQVFSKHYHDDPLIDIDLAYIHFACEKPMLYRTLWVEDQASIVEMRNFAMILGRDRFAQKAEADGLSAEKIHRILIGNWIIVNGLANLISTGYISMSKAQMVNVIDAQLQDYIYNDRFNPDNQADDELEFRSALAN